MVQTPVIETTDLVIGYKQKANKRLIVHDALQIQLFTGELTILLGLNGAGKSTLLRTLCGFQPALGGQILLKGRPLSDYSQTELSRTTGVVLTEKTHAGGITVQELVSLGRHPYTGFFGKLKSVDRQIVSESMEAVGIADKSSHVLSELSDGERQKVMIAKALAQQCPIILLDEPTAYLDVTNRIEIMSLLRHLAVAQGKAILLSTHDLDLALRMSDRLWLLEKKRPMACGTTEDLILDGTFATFFKKENIAFDVTTGQLTIDKPAVPIAVEGDSKTTFWVGNALQRHGFRPSTAAESNFCIRCNSPQQMTLIGPDSSETTVASIAELITAIRTTFKNYSFK